MIKLHRPPIIFNSATACAQQLGKPRLEHQQSTISSLKLYCCTERLGNDSAWEMMSHTVVENSVLELHEGVMVVCIAGINFQGLILVNKSS